MLSCIRGSLLKSADGLCMKEFSFATRSSILDNGTMLATLQKELRTNAKPKASASPVVL